jgi:iron complex transport system ATP-binding protein
MKIEISDLSFSFGETRILKDISFEVGEGEFLGLMGPNGSGKTTLLRCLTRYLPTDARAVHVDMKPLHTLTDREVASTFAVVPQSSTTDFPFTVRDVVMMGRIPHAHSRFSGARREDAEVVARSMDAAGCTRLADRPFSELSGGERQRAVIARALAQEPRALLLDEPTVYLDISGQLEMMDLVKRLSKERGLTVVAVLHDINLAARYCDRIALLSQGRLAAIGQPSEVLNPETIQGVYGVDVAVRRDPFTNAVYIMPKASGARVARHGAKVHLLCGGGTGGPLMKSLLDLGYSVSAGVLNVLDSDYECAKDLHIPVAAEIPFSQISVESHYENLRMADEASVVVVSQFPVGPGNFRNLEAARHALDSGKKVIVFVREDPSTVDFVGGKATEFIKGLISSGAIEVKSLDEIVERLRGLSG